MRAALIIPAWEAADPDSGARRAAAGSRAGREVQQDVDRLDRTVTSATLARLQQLRRELQGVIAAGGSTFRRFTAQGLIVEVDRLIADATRDLANSTRPAFANASRLGIAAVEEPVKAARISLTPAPRLDVTLVTSAFELTGDLLTEPMQQFRNQIVRQIRRATTIGTDNGLPELARKIDAAGFDHAKFRAERIIRTETSRVLNEATYARMLSLAQTMPFLRKGWRAANDNRTRLGHREARATYARGQGIPIQDPFKINVYQEKHGGSRTPAIAGAAPKLLGTAMLRFPVDPDATPAGRIAAGATIMCFVPGSEVSGSFVSGSVVGYDGEVIELLTERSHRLTVTPNHPVLTVRGWVAAGEIRNGDHVLCDDTWFESLPRGSANNQKYAPALIENVFETLRQSGGSASVKVAPHDFHGDGRSAHGEIEVVPAARQLRFRGDPAAVECDEHFALAGKHATQVPMSSDRPTPHDLLGVQDLPGGMSRGLNLPSNARGVPLHPLPLEALRVGAAADLDALLAEIFQQRRPTDGHVLADRLQRFPTRVATDEIVKIRRRKHHGLVYDLEAVNGFIVAGGIIASNCRCNAFTDFNKADLSAFSTARSRAVTPGAPQLQPGQTLGFPEPPVGPRRPPKTTAIARIPTGPPLPGTLVRKDPVRSTIPGGRELLKSYSPEVVRALEAAHRDLMAASGFDGDDPRRYREVLQTINADGTRGPLHTGGRDYVEISTAVEQDMRTAALFIHTHPSSAAFSYADAYQLARFNKPGFAMIVYGRSGAWYELTAPPAWSLADPTFIERTRLQFEQDHRHELFGAGLRAKRRTDALIPELARERGVSTFAVMAGAAQDEELQNLYTLHVQEEIIDGWQTVAAKYGLTFRFYLPPESTKNAKHRGGFVEATIDEAARAGRLDDWEISAAANRYGAGLSPMQTRQLARLKALGVEIDATTGERRVSRTPAAGPAMR